MREMIRCP